MINKLRLTRFQSRTLRYLTKFPWVFRNYVICQGLRIPTLANFLGALVFNFFSKAGSSLYPLHFSHCRRFREINSTDNTPPPMFA